MALKIDMTGNRYNMLIVVRFDHIDALGRAQWLCRCDCGAERVAVGAFVRNGDVKSCRECRKRSPGPVKHGDTKCGKLPRLYRTWAGMKTRGTNPKHRYYQRGIRMCEEWRDWQAFKAWALANGYADDLEIDRIDNDGDYRPENCRFVTRTVNVNNSRHNHYIEANGKRQSAADWAREIGISYAGMKQRLRRKGWTDEQAVTTPVRRWPSQLEGYDTYGA